MPAIVPCGCLAIDRASARKFWRLRIGPQLEPLGNDCPHARTKVDTRYPGVPRQDETCSSLALAERLRRCVAFNLPEWYAFSDHGPIVATFED